MLGALKKWGTNLVLKAKDLFTSPDSQVYVKDLRKVMVYKDGRKCQYPKNYDQIVKYSKIIESKDVRGNSILDGEKNPTYKLLYGDKNKDGWTSFRLTLVNKNEKGGKSYFTINYTDNQGKQIPIGELHESYFEPFGFSRLDLRKRVPVFEAERTEDPKYPFQLTNSSVLTKEEKNKEGKIQKVIDEEGRNGELLYTSDYKKLNTSFFEIRDQSNNLELDKSLISVPVVFITSLAKVCAKWLTYLPMKLGEHLISKKNPIAKSFGYLLFISAVAAKSLVNMGATILKAPILLFVADEKKYGDAYWTMWKHQLGGYWKEARNDFNVIKDGKRAEPEKKDYPEYEIAGTWKELDAENLSIEGNLERGLTKSSGSTEDKSREQNKSNEKIAKLENQRESTFRADKVKQWEDRKVQLYRANRTNQRLL